MQVDEIQDQNMQDQDIRHYLKNHPEFFEQNANFLAEIHLPSPHGNGTISLAERQQLAQRDKISALEQRFAELVANAQENDATANKIHALNLDLHQARNFNAIEQLISHHLPENFDLSDTCLRVWAAPLDRANQSNLVFSNISDEAKTWLAALPQAYCGAPPAIVNDDWFLEPAVSVAIIPLTITHTNKQLIGFLALASDSKNRFYQEMGADFLNKVGELISAALTRHIELS